MHPLSLIKLNQRHFCGFLLLISSGGSLFRTVSSFQAGTPNLHKSRDAVARESSAISMPPRSSRTSTARAADSGERSPTPVAQFITNPRCPFAQKAWIALEASGCLFEAREVSLYGPGGKPDWFWELNSQGTVPVLAVKRDGGEEVFADSELILDALGDGRVASKGGVLPRGDMSEEESVRVEEWRAAISTRVIPVGKSAVLGGSLPALRSLLKDLDALVAGPYLAGERVTLADCAAFPFLWRVDQEFGIGTSAAAGDEGRLRAWLDTCLRTPAIKKTVPRQGGWWW